MPRISGMAGLYVALAVCAGCEVARGGEMSGKSDERLYVAPMFGFSGCSEPISEIFRVQGAERDVGAVLSAGCGEDGPFHTPLGLFVREDRGWRLFFSGDYHAPVWPSGRSGSAPRIMTGRGDQPRLTFAARAGEVVLLTTGGAVVATTRPAKSTPSASP